MTSRADTGIAFAAGSVGSPFGGYTNVQCSAGCTTTATATSLGWFFSFSTLGYKGIQVSFSAAPAISAVSPVTSVAVYYCSVKTNAACTSTAGTGAGIWISAGTLMLPTAVYSCTACTAPCTPVFCATMKPFTLVLPVAADTSSNVNVKLIPAGGAAAKQVGFNPIVITALAAG